MRILNPAALGARPPVWITERSFRDWATNLSISVSNPAGGGPWFSADLMIERNGMSVSRSEGERPEDPASVTLATNDDAENRRLLQRERPHRAIPRHQHVLPAVQGVGLCGVVDGPDLRVPQRHRGSTTLQLQSDEAARSVI